MNHRTTILLLIIIGTICTLFAQTVIKTLTLSENGTVTAPSNFWTTNAPGIQSALTNWTGSTNLRPSGLWDNGTNRISATGGSILFTGQPSFDVSSNWRTALGLGTAATNAAANFAPAAGSTNYATAAQGALAATALQPGTSITNTVGTLETNRLPNITLNLPGILHNTPVNITNGSGTATLANQLANRVLAGPASGNATAPTWRALVTDDLPNTGGPSGAFGGPGIALQVQIDNKGRVVNAFGHSLPTISTTSPLEGGGDLTANRTLSILTANATQSGIVTSAAQTFGGAKTFASDVSVNGNTTLGDAAGDSLTVNAGTISAPNASSVGANHIARVGALDARYGGPVVMVRASADLTRTNLAAITDDPELSVTLPAGTWHIIVVYRIGYASTAGVRWRVDVSPDNALTSWTGLLLQNPSTVAFQSGLFDQESSVAPGSSGAISLRLEAITPALTSTQTVKLQWSQHTSDAAATTRLAGSFILARRIQ